jgi:hypothetical protein
LEIASAFEIPYNMFSNIPIGGAIVVHELAEFLDSEGNVGTCSDCKIHEKANKSAVGEVE